MTDPFPRFFRWGVLGLLIMSLFLTSCSNDPGGDTGDGEGETLPEDPISYEEYFESLTVTDPQAHPSLRVPMTGDISDVINDHTLLTSKDNQIFTYDLNTKESILLAAKGWNERLSMDKKVIAYENEEGITTVSADGRNESLMYKRTGDVVLREYILSRDGQSLLVFLLDGEDPKSLLITNDGQTKEMTFGEGDDFRITKPLYLTRFRLYALAESSRDVAGEDGSVRASSIDFVYFDLTTGSRTNITGNAFGDSLEYMDQSGNGNILLRHLRQSTNEDGLVVTETFKTFNTTTEFISSSSIANRNILVFKSIDDERDYLTIERPEVQDNRYPAQVVLRRYTNNAGETIGTLFTGAPSQIFYHQGYLFFNSNKDTYRIQIQR